MEFVLFLLSLYFFYFYFFFPTQCLLLIPKVKKNQAGAGILVSVGSAQSAVVGTGCVQL